MRADHGRDVPERAGLARLLGRRGGAMRALLPDVRKRLDSCEPILDHLLFVRCELLRVVFPFDSLNLPLPEVRLGPYWIISWIQIVVDQKYLAPLKS